MAAVASGPSPLRLRLFRPLLRAWPTQRGRWRLASLLLVSSPRGGDVLEARLVPNLPDEVVNTAVGVALRVRPDSHFLSPYLFGDYEPESGRVLQRLLSPGDVVLDVGANIGWYAALFGKAVGARGRVVAFEPLPHFAEAARGTIALNELDGTVEIRETGIGAVMGELIIHTFHGLPGGHASASDLGRIDAEPHRCPVSTLDGEVERHGLEEIALLKVDVEGFEREVFEGASALLARGDAPAVHFEVNQTCLRARGLTPADTFAPLKAAGYDALWRIDQAGRPVDLQEPLADVDGDYVAAKGAAAARVRVALSSGRRAAARA